MVGSVVMPDRGESQVHTAHFTRTVNVNAADIINGTFKVLMRPDLFMPGYITAAANIIPAAALGPLNITAFVPITGPTVLADESSVTATNTTGSETLIFPIYTLFADPTKQGINIVIDPLNPPTYDITMLNTGNVILNAQVTEYDAAGAVLIMRNFQLAKGPKTLLGIAMNAACVAVGIAAPLNTHNGQGVKATITCSSAQVLSGPTVAYAPAFARQVVDDNIVSGRVITMGMLCHNTSPAVLQGGVVNAARAPYNMPPFTVGTHTVQASVSKLPANRRYQDSAQDGSYCFWIPATTQEWDVGYIQDLEQTYAQANYLIAEFDSLPIGSSFMIQFDWIVEFYVQNQLFPVEPTPPLLPVVEEYRQALLRLDAATANSDHITAIKSFVSAIKQKGNQLYQHFESNREFYNVLISALATLGGIA